jgi:peptidoglycan/xylan/chitin deacetylase (PgdA/CDA1 family)
VTCVRPVRFGRRALLSAGLLAAAAGCTSSSHPGLKQTGQEQTGQVPTQSPPAPPRLPAQVTAGPRDRPRVALTFHGAGDPALAAALLGEATRAAAPLTVLAVGRWLENQPALARRILDAGCELGNHTYTHPVLPRLGADAVYREIARCAEVLRRLTGSKGRWFRPSGTPRATPIIEAAARRAGYPTCLGYDVDPRDYADPGALAVTSRVLGAVRPGSVISLHLGHQGTVAALPGILDGLRRAGLAPVTVSTLLGVPT